jgi:hypothetical protein
MGVMVPSWSALQDSDAEQVQKYVWEGFEKSQPFK